ncbi:hypothetical protein CRYUN_Cryun16bG0132300 [Craigia yunnanensis]
MTIAIIGRIVSSVTSLKITTEKDVIRSHNLNYFYLCFAGYGCLIRYSKVAPSDAGVVHGFVGGRSLGGGFGSSGGGGDGGG